MGRMMHMLCGGIKDWGVVEASLLDHVKRLSLLLHLLEAPLLDHVLSNMMCWHSRVTVLAVAANSA